MLERMFLLFMMCTFVLSSPQDCDMPEELKVPEAMEDGIASVDVMDFLGLNRASSSKADDASASQ